jgi:hypothetical protein
MTEMFACCEFGYPISIIDNTGFFEALCQGRSDEVRFGIVAEAPGFAWLGLNRLPLRQSR